MTDAARLYLHQPATRLGHSGVDGRAIEELIAELVEHLDDKDTAPIGEFGPIPELAVQLIDERRVGRPARWRRVALPCLGAAQLDPAVRHPGEIAAEASTRRPKPLTSPARIPGHSPWESGRSGVT
ncbi:MAG: hypothetical protein GXP34_03065 [Actinobacteria bacterium]|nr:hypothetical protein [Actinomycetota bacterium]